MVVMRLVADRERGVLRVRVLACDCNPGCPQRLVAAATDRQPRLWLTCGVAQADDVAEQVDWLLGDEEAISGVTASEIVEHGVACLGLTWDRLLAGGQPRALMQLKAFAEIPEWMTAVPVEDVLRVRGVVFGDDVSRVPRALAALRDAYDCGGRPAGEVLSHE